jgi:hypothetical protein
MVAQVHGEMQQKYPRVRMSAAERDRKWSVELRRINVSECPLQLRIRSIHERAQLSTRYIAKRELGVARTYVATLSQRGTNEPAQIADQVQHQRPTGVAHARNDAPRPFIVVIRIDFPPNSIQFAREDSGEIIEPRA